MKWPRGLPVKPVDRIVIEEMVVPDRGLEEVNPPPKGDRLPACAAGLQPASVFHPKTWNQYQENSSSWSLVPQRMCLVMMKSFFPKESMYESKFVGVSNSKAR